MFWNDIADIKLWMDRLTDRLIRIDQNIEELLLEDKKNADLIESRLIEFTYTINEKLDFLSSAFNIEERVSLATKTLDKFEEYMKNADKLNTMLNEFKGCVSIARGAISERKELDQHTAKVAAISQEIHKSMLAFINAGEKLESKAHYKIDAIYKAVCETNEKKSRKTAKVVKKKKRNSVCPALVRE